MHKQLDTTEEILRKLTNYLRYTIIYRDCIILQDTFVQIDYLGA